MLSFVIAAITRPSSKHLFTCIKKIAYNILIQDLTSSLFNQILIDSKYFLSFFSKHTFNRL